MPGKQRMSQTVLGQHLNKDVRTIQKYESGED
jgi:ribosome-binding protein aMBF1 (putative translation factor)